MLITVYNCPNMHCYSTELLAEILASPELYVMQVEMDVYTLAKRVSHISILACREHITRIWFWSSDQWYSESIATLSYMQWLFLLLNPDWSGEFEKLTSDADEYFRNQGKYAYHIVCWC